MRLCQDPPNRMSSRFPSTRWTLIMARRAAPDRDVRSDHNLAAELCLEYWKPIFSYLRADGFTREDAEDLTQGFFVAALESDLFEKVDRELGSLRSYLLGALKNFVQGQGRKNRAQKRGGRFHFVPIDTLGEERTRRFRVTLTAPDLSPDLAFDRRWAECLLESTLAGMREEYAAAGKERHYEVLRPLLDGGGDSSQAAVELGISEGAMRVLLHRFRKRYRDRVRRQIRNTIAPGLDEAAEFTHLLEAMGAGKLV